MSGNAYQLRFDRILPIGTYVQVLGPHDTYGKVYAHQDGARGVHVHHVRGIGHVLPTGKYPIPPQESGPSD